MSNKVWILEEAMIDISTSNYSNMLNAVPEGVKYGGVEFNKPEHFSYSDRVVDQGTSKMYVDSDMVDYAKLMLIRVYAKHICEKYKQDR